MSTNIQHLCVRYNLTPHLKTNESSWTVREHVLIIQLSISHLLQQSLDNDKNSETCQVPLLISIGFNIFSNLFCQDSHYQIER